MNEESPVLRCGEESQMAYCADSCGRPATTERLISVIPTSGCDFIELVELVCVECERTPVGLSNG